MFIGLSSFMAVYIAEGLAFLLSSGFIILYFRFFAIGLAQAVIFWRKR
jgi:hypothetical protein